MNIYSLGEIEKLFGNLIVRNRFDHMKRFIQYILLVMIGVLASCQRPELVEQLPDIEVEGGESRRVPILFSAVIPGMEATTKSMDHEPDITSLHLVVFDEKGMYVETAEAKLIEGTYTGIHGQNYHMNFQVTLTLSEEPRIIHFIANCPVDQISYGHEASIIGNLYVENGQTAYWSRAEVPHIQVYENQNTTTPDTPSTSAADDLPSSGDGLTFRPCTHLNEHLEHVHLLRNFAEIVVEDKTDSVARANNKVSLFKLKGFAVYNTISKGTVAPYNINTQEFQCFVDHDKAHNSEGETVEEIYDYDHLVDSLSYEGHALASATLNPSLTFGPNGKWYGHNYAEDPNLTDTSNDLHYFMYERKVSVKTDEEDKWRESPPHIIINANYNGQNCYYKFDLVYTYEPKDSNGNVIDSELRYYNVLRNFLYRFVIIDVDSPGYATIDEAIAGAPSNNLATSSTTSKFPDISVGGASLSVSYTDTTLVSGGLDNKIHFKYLYEPQEPVVAGDEARLVYTLYSADDPNSNPNDVITNIRPLGTIASGTWAGYQDVEITVREPQTLTLEQVLEVRTNNQNLVRKIRFILSKKKKMQVGCKPRIFSGISVPQTVQIKLPEGLTDDMFPLDLAIETKGLTLSPNAEMNSIPVQTGESIIPDKNGQKSFYFTYRVELEDYSTNLERDNKNNRIINTHWLTNTVNNASRVYVANKYFEIADTAWVNVDYEFSNPRVVTQNISKGLDRDVSISFVMDGDDSSSSGREIKISLDGLRNPTSAADDDETVMQITTVSSGNVTVSGNRNAKTVTITGLKTTDPEGKVGFTLDSPAYMLASAESGDRVTNSFNGKFVNADGSDDDGKVDAGAGIAVYYKFDIPTYFGNATQGMVVNVTLDGLVPASTEKRLTLVETSGTIKKYTFTASAAGSYTLSLQTANKDASICAVSLDTKAEYYYTPVKSTINQAMREFPWVTISTVKQGVRRPVIIEFQLADGDTAAEAKDINVSLVGMTRNGQSSFKINTGTSDVTKKGTTYTINNVVTSSLDADLKVTLAASDYMSKSAECTNRELGEFTAISLNPTSLEPKAGEVVTLKFSSNDFINGMKVYLELDGLEPVTAAATSKAVTSFEYTVSGTGEQTVNLQTTKAESRTCTAQVKAEGFEDSDRLEVVQSAGVSIPIGNLIFPNNTYQYYVYYTNPGIDTSIQSIATIDIDSKTTGTGLNRQTIYYNAKKVELKGVSLNDTIYIRYSYRRGAGTRYYVASVKLTDAVNGEVELSFSRVYN